MTTDVEPAADPDASKGHSRSRIRRFVAVIAIVAIVEIAGTVALTLTRPIQLVVMDGRALGPVEGNLTNITDTRFALVLSFNATTYANQSQAPASTLSMRVETETYYDGLAGAVYLYGNATVLGHFASNLNPQSLRLTLNNTGPAISLNAYVQEEANVSFDGQGYMALGPGSTGSVAAVFTNGGGASRGYDFGFREWFHVVWRPWYNHFVGLRAIVEGPFTPAVEVSVLLKIVNTEGGTWP